MSTSSSPGTTPTPAASSSVTPSVAPTPAPSGSAATVAACTTSQLLLSTGRGGAATGTFYLPLVFTNTSNTTCSLRGYPGASFVDANGQQLGASAQRSEGEPVRRVVLASGGKAHALLGIPESANFSQSDCRPRKASGVRAYSPDQTQSLVAHVKLTICTTKNGRASIQEIRPGTQG